MMIRFKATALVTTVSLLMTACVPTETENVDTTGKINAVQISNIIIEDALQSRQVPYRVAWPDTASSLPVIVFSHGSLCDPDTYAPVTDYWAEQGYAVISPMHLDAPAAGITEPLAPPVLLNSRMREISLALDSLDAVQAQLGGFRGKLDESRAAVAGHSFGGMIAMLKSGLELEGEFPPTVDERFKVAVIMSGVGPMPPFTSEASFGGLTLPLIANGGSLDVGNIGTGPIFPWEWRMSPYSLAPDGDKYALEIDMADHFFGGLIGGKESDTPPDNEALEAVVAAQVLFLDAYVKGDAKALQELQSTPSAARLSFKTK